MPAKPAIHSVAFFLASWACVCKKRGRNEDSCTRRANDLEANYTFFKGLFLILAFWIDAAMPFVYVCTLYTFRGADFVYVSVDFQVRLTKLELLKGIDLRSSPANMHEGTRNAESHASWIRYRCSCRRELCTLPAVSNSSLFNCEAEKAYVCSDYSILNTYKYMLFLLNFLQYIHTHTRTFLVDYNMHTLDQKTLWFEAQSGLEGQWMLIREVESAARCTTRTIKLWGQGQDYELPDGSQWCVFKHLHWSSQDMHGKWSTKSAPRPSSKRRTPQDAGAKYIEINWEWWNALLIDRFDGLRLRLELLCRRSTMKMLR